MPCAPLPRPGAWPFGHQYRRPPVPVPGEVAVEGSPPDALGALSLPSTVVGEGDALVAGADSEAGADADGPGEDDEEPGAEGEVAELGGSEVDGAPDRAAGAEGDAAGDCDVVTVALGDAVSGAAEGLEVV